MNTNEDLEQEAERLRELLTKVKDVDELDYNDWVVVTAAYLTVKFLVTESEVLGVVAYLGDRLDRKEAWALLVTAGYGTTRGCKFGRGLVSILKALGYFKHSLHADEVLGALHGWPTGGGD